MPREATILTENTTSKHLFMLNDLYGFWRNDSQRKTENTVSIISGQRQNLLTDSPYLEYNRTELNRTERTQCTRSFILIVVVSRVEYYHHIPMVIDGFVDH